MLRLRPIREIIGSHGTEDYGHVRGDDCLKRIAETVGAGASRPRDFLARYGGEEFVLVLPDTDAKGAEHIAARCREAVASQAIAHESSTIASHVTISIGVRTIVPSAEGDPMQFVDVVDKRLYRAKQSGRNRLVASDELADRQISG